MKIVDEEFDWLESCPLCGDGRQSVWETAAGGYSVQPVRVKCGGCGLIFSNPQASEKRLKYFYGKVYFQQADYKAGYFDQANADAERAKGHEELALLEKYAGPGRVLDVGCAAGYFLDAAKERGWQAEGVEMSAAAAADAKKRGHRVHVGMLEKLKLKGRYDAVHAAHTLEHVKDPVAFLARLKSLLRPGGKLMIEVPNAYHLWALIWHYGPKLRGRSSPLVYAKEHTFDFSRATLTAAHQKAGLRPLRRRVYEYPGGALDLWRKPGENPAKALVRAGFVAAAKITGLASMAGSYLQFISEKAE